MSKENKTSHKASRFLDMYKSFDFFGEGVSFEVNGSSTFNSCPGATLSLSIIVITVLFALNRLNALINFDETIHL